MKKYAALLIVLMAGSSCGIISKQYYYALSVRHQTVKTRLRRSDFKMIYSRFALLNMLGDSIGSVMTSSGIRHPWLMGPFLPVIPVGFFFAKSSRRFLLEMTVKTKEGYFMPLAINSNDYKNVSDSLNALGIGTKRLLQHSECYMLVNDTLKVPLIVNEFFMGHTGSQSYWVTADIPFRKVNSLKLITENSLLDVSLREFVFNRKSRIKFDLVGPGY